MSNKTELISFFGESPTFREKFEKNFKNINLRTFNQKIGKLKAVANLKFLWKKIDESENKFLQKISLNINYKKVLKATLDVVKEEVGMVQSAKKQTLDSKIKSAKKFK